MGMYALRRLVRRMGGEGTKIALIIVGPVKQVVLTPEDDDEKAILKVFGSEKDINIAKSTFYLDRAQGGFINQYGATDSVILTTSSKEKP